MPQVRSGDDRYLRLGVRQATQNGGEQVTPFNADNQRGRVLRLLRAWPRCGTDFLDVFIPRYGARIWELKREGYQITKRLCDQHRHNSRQYLYELVS